MAGKRDQNSGKGNKKMKVLILGIGNPILTDDAVGILVVRELGDVNADVEEASIGGHLLLDLIRGYDKVIIVDAVQDIDKEREPGTIIMLQENDIKGTLHSSSSHDVSFSEAIRLGRTLFPDEMPSEIVAVGIEVNDTQTFSETPTDAVARAVPGAVKTVKDLLENWRQHP